MGQAAEHLHLDLCCRLLEVARAVDTTVAPEELVAVVPLLAVEAETGNLAAAVAVDMI